MNLKFRGPDWPTFEIPKFDNITDKENLLQMREDVEKFLNAREESIKDPNFWSKSKKKLRNIFTATSPIAKNLLQIAKQGSAVYSSIITPLIRVDDTFESVRIAFWGPFAFDNGISAPYVIYFQIADREVTRKEDVEKKIEHISRKLKQLEIVNQLPDVGYESGPLINTAIDVVSAAYTYIAVHIRYEATLLGIIGN